jgi:UDP:flavonoid glycosyltransferase YjiC (YdhE family)
MTNNRKRIVLTTIGSLGDLHPMIALAIELERRGHKATIATIEAYRQKIESIGIGFHPIRPNGSPDDPELVRQVMDLKKGPEFLIRQVLMPHLRDMYDDLIAVAPENDFMISGEIVFAAPIVAEKINLRWASVTLAPSSFFSVSDPPVLAPWAFMKNLHNAPTFLHRLIIGLGKRTIKSWGKPVADLRRELGLPETADPLFKDRYSPYLNLAMFSRVLGAPQPDWAANTLQTGFVFYDKQQHDASAPAELKAFLDTGEPPIVFTLGSAAVLKAGTFYEESVKAVQKLGRRAILLVGKNVLRQELPETIAVFDYTPYSAVLPRAACVVHQGGVGTTAQVLSAGVPQLVMPYSFDQPDNAARVERLGVARTIGRNEYTAERAAKLLGALLCNPSYAQRATEVARQVQEEDGLRESCDAIEKQMCPAKKAHGQ